MVGYGYFLELPILRHQYGISVAESQTFLLVMSEEKRLPFAGYTLPPWYTLTHTSTSDTNEIMTESIRKLSNFNFQWTKTMHQNKLNNITFL